MTRRTLITPENNKQSVDSCSSWKIRSLFPTFLMLAKSTPGADEASVVTGSVNGERALGSGEPFQFLCKGWHSKDAQPRGEGIDQATTAGWCHRGRGDPVMSLGR